jgi:WD40 repeat protein
VAVTPDGTRAVSASEDRTLKVWDLGSGAMLRSLEGHAEEVSAVVVTPDGTRAISASNDGTLKVWDLGTGAMLRSLEGHPLGVRAVAVTPDGSRAASASSDRTLKVWDLGSGVLLATFATDYPLTCCAVSPSGKTFIAAGDMGRAHFLRWEGT